MFWEVTFKEKQASKEFVSKLIDNCLGWPETDFFGRLPTKAIQEQLVQVAGQYFSENYYLSKQSCFYNVTLRFLFK